MLRRELARGLAPAARATVGRHEGAAFLGGAARAVDRGATRVRSRRDHRAPARRRRRRGRPDRVRRAARSRPARGPARTVAVDAADRARDRRAALGQRARDVVHRARRADDGGGSGRPAGGAMIAAVALVAYAALYAAGVRRVRRWPASRSASFAAGVALLAVALEAPLDDRLSGHMAQHLILGVAAPLCLAASAPVRLAF